MKKEEKEEEDSYLIKDPYFKLNWYSTLEEKDSYLTEDPYS